MTAADDLLQACFEGNTQMALRALATEPQIANARCAEIDSPALVIAAHRGYLEIVRALLTAGAQETRARG